MSTRIFGAPHRYIQGPGALDELGQIALPFGNNPVVIADAFILEKFGARLAAIFADAGLNPILHAFGGEITYAAIETVQAELGDIRPSVAIGIGGGKSLDAAWR